MPLIRGVPHLADGGVTGEEDEQATQQPDPNGTPAGFVAPPNWHVADPMMGPEAIQAQQDARLAAEAQAAADPETARQAEIQRLTSLQQRLTNSTGSSDPQVAAQLTTLQSQPVASPLAAAGGPVATMSPATQVPATSPTAPNPLAGMERAVKGLKSSYDANADMSSLAGPQGELSGAQTALGTKIAEGGQREADLGNELAKTMSTDADTAKAHKEASDKAIAPTLEAFKNSKIDPNKLWKDMGFGAKATTIIGQMLGAFAAGYGHGPNFAQQIIDHAIDQNIAAQRGNIEQNGKLLEFQRQQGLDNQQMDALMRLSHREIYGAKLEAVRSGNLSEQKQALIGKEIAANKLKEAQDARTAAGTAGIAKAQANLGLETTKANLGLSSAAAAATGDKVKDESVNKFNKAMLGIKLLDELHGQTQAGFQSGLAGAGGLFQWAAKNWPGSKTQSAADLRHIVADELAAAKYPDSNRPPPPEFVKRVEEQLESSSKSPGRNDNAYRQLRSVFEEQAKNHYYSGHGQFPPDSVLAPMTAPADKVPVINIKTGAQVMLPAAMAKQGIEMNHYRPVGP